MSPRTPIAVAVAGLLLLAGCGTAATTPAASGATPAASVAAPAVPSMTMPMSAPPSSAAVQAPVSGNAVTISNFAFAPANLKVKAGTAVTWTNKDEDPHTVVATGSLFKSEVLQTGASYTFTFTTPGTYDYLCSIHPFMTATVTVTA